VIIAAEMNRFIQKKKDRCPNLPKGTTSGTGKPSLFAM
jgi:hypothetical protein